jgi:hypothetical protein
MLDCILQSATLTNINQRRSLMSVTRISVLKQLKRSKQVKPVCGLVLRV